MKSTNSGLFAAALLACLPVSRVAHAEPTIIDTHLHAFACKPDGLDQLARWMSDNGVSRAIVHPLSSSRATTGAERRRMLASFRKYQGKIDRFCILEPDEVATVDEAVERLTKEKRDGAIGFGEHYGKGLMFDDPKNMRLYQACATVGLPVMFHMDNNQNKDTPGFPHLENALKAHPKCVFIAHGPFWWKRFGTGDCDRLLTKYPNLYADISAGSGSRALARSEDKTAKFMVRHRNKLLFGTDCGWWSFKKGAKRAPQFDFMKSLNLPDDVRAGIYHDNAGRLFGFQHPSGAAFH